MSDIIKTIIKSGFSMIGNIMKYGFYSTLCIAAFAGMFLYNTKPKMNGLTGYLLNTYLIDDYVFFKIASFGQVKYIGIANNWIQIGK